MKVTGPEPWLKTMPLEEVLTFGCPACLQHSAVTVSLVSGRQQMVEDCQNCCEPIELELTIRDGEILRFDYRLAN